MLVAYFTSEESADLSNIGFYSECVEAAANVLKLAGFNVRLFKSVNVIELKLADGSLRYIENIPKILKYPSNFKVNLCKQDIMLKDHTNGYFGVLFRYDDYLHIRGELYLQLTITDPFRGYINGRMYMSYDNNWINPDAYPYNKTSKNIEYDVFTPEFTPAQPLEIDIKNEDFKLINDEKLLEHSINSITIFARLKLITMGKYSKIDEPGPFKYIDPNDVKYVLATSVVDKTINSLISVDNEIVLDDLEKYKLEEKDGFYSNYEIIGEFTKTRDICVYCYNYVFFAFNRYTNKVQELEVRKLLSGKHTKAASSF
jgi:hypothetical protein